MYWFARQLLRWHDDHGRNDLPWQVDKTPYRVWLAEIMLQQTQVATVIPYFHTFIERFPTLASLAEASEDEVLHLWTGLGYYRRARMLLQTAQIVKDHFNGEFPQTLEELWQLPGIGRSTAGAILSSAFNKPEPILDGNVRRVLSRFHGVGGQPQRSVTERTLWELAANHTPRQRAATFNQAIMDLGAGVCSRTKPRCNDCPVKSECYAHKTDTIELYPAKKINRSKRKETIRMVLILDSENRCLLQKRPEKGIWASLWAPPEIGLDQDIATAIETLGLPTVSDACQLNELRLEHRLSHIDLTIRAFPLKYPTSSVPKLRSDMRWFSADADEQVGVSAATLKLMDAVKQTELEI